MALRYGRTRAGEVTVALLPGPAPEPPPGSGADADADPDRDGEPDRGPLGDAGPDAVRQAPIPTVTDRSLTADRRGRLTLTVRCAATTDACPGRLTLTLAGVRRTAPFTAPAGKTVRVRVTLTAAQRRSLTRHKRVNAKVTFAVAGTTRTLTSRSAGRRGDGPPRPPAGRTCVSWLSPGESAATHVARASGGTCASAASSPAAAATHVAGARRRDG